MSDTPEDEAEDHETDPDDMVDINDEDYEPQGEAPGIDLREGLGMLVPKTPPSANPPPEVPEIIEDDDG